MKLEAAFWGWFETLGAIFAEARDAWRTRRSIIVRKDGECFLVRRANEPDGKVLANVAVGTRMPGEIARRLRSFFVNFELAPGDVVSRRLEVPTQAKEFLSGIVRNQIERLSPWPAGNTVYGFAIRAERTQAGALDVRVAISSRAMIEATSDRLAASGLPPDRILVRPQGQGEPPIALWTRASPAATTGWRPSRIIAASLAAFIALSVAATAWSLYSASELAAEREDVAARAQSFRQHAPASAPKDALAALAPPERAWAMKESTPAAILVLEALARALPDSAYLTELTLERATLRMTGLAANAPALIEALEQSRRFSGVRFFAATTKGAENDLYRFNIEAQVPPNLELIGD
jgi:general secretion pathway protein L